jgi:hypothetical protein
MRGQHAETGGRCKQVVLPKFDFCKNHPGIFVAGSSNIVGRLVDILGAGKIAPYIQMFGIISGLRAA